MAIPLRCECGRGRGLKAPDQRAGQTFRCIYCGRVLPVPALVRESGPEGEPAGERPVLRGALPDLPALSIALGIVGLVDTAVVGVVGVLVWLAMNLVAAGAERTISEGGAAEEADPAAAVVRQLKAEGKNVMLNEESADAAGRRVRRIEYTDRNGVKGVQTVLLGAASARPLGETARKQLDRAKLAARIAAVVGILLAAIAAGKLACSIGFFLRRGWGRAGLVGLAGIQSALVVLGVLLGGSSPFLLFSLLVNGMVFVYFLSGPVREACTE